MKKKTLITLIILATLLLLGALGLLTLLNARTTNSEPVRINLPEGSTYEALCDSLSTANTNVLTQSHTTAFNLFAHALKLHQRVRPGSYIVQPHTTQLALVRKLRNGQQDPIRLTIGRFRTPEQLNHYLNQKLMHNDFHLTLDSFYIIRPNTYEFYWTVTPRQFMQRMEQEYDKFSKALTEKNEGNRIRINSDFSVREIIILASIVEEETNNNAEKPLIASVYLNRLAKGMPLQADPTVKYAVGDFTLRRILNSHLAVDSPFNTYLHSGLPPAPICLPSAASVDAVLNAPQTNYLYFCASDLMDGTHRFAATLAEHNRNAARFHQKLNSMKIK